MKDTADTADRLAPGVVVVFGGRSEIGTELAVRLAPGATVVLAARGPERLGEQV
ncbi:oxidoreductase, partial [Mycolicibacterium sp. KC 300]|nr:oxidoreductase [Mycolicibacterium arseniciresistens]